MTTHFTAHSKCRLCDSGNIEEVLDLGYSPLANAYLTAEQLAEVRTGKREEIFTPLRLFLCMDCGSVQLAHSVDPKILFTDYIYASSTSPVFVKHFEELALHVMDLGLVGENDFVVDIGCNDGVLLKAFDDLKIHLTLGVEPSKALADIATSKGCEVLPYFWDATLAKDIVSLHGKAKVITACNVFAHLSDLHGFMDGVDALLDDDGVFIFENSYLGDVVDKMLFDTIYMEHQFYHSITPLVDFFANRGMRVFRFEHIDTHGGSIRSFVDWGKHKGEQDHITAVTDAECEAGLFDIATYRQFGDRLQCYKHRLHSVLRPYRNLFAYGCPAKFTTFCYALGLERTFPFVVDDSPLKSGHFTPGSHAPIYHSGSERASTLLNVNHLAVVSAWNFFDSIFAKRKGFAPVWLRPLPNLEVVHV